MSRADERPAPRQEYVRAGRAVQHLQLRPAARARPDRAHVRQEGPEGHRLQRAADGSGLRVGRGQPRLQVRDPGRKSQGSADRRQRQHRHRARRARLRHGHLRDVSDHAGNLGLALPVGMLRAGRRHRAPGRRRDRRLCVRDRRVLRRPLRGDDHLGAGLLAEAGRHRAGGDGGDPAGRRQRPARRPLHRPADQGRAGRPADRHLRQPWRRAEGRDRRDQHRGLLLLDDHGAQDRRDIQHGRGRADRREPGDGAAAVRAARTSPRSGWRRRSTSRRCPRVPSPTTGTRSPASRAASRRASRTACTR